MKFDFRIFVLRFFWFIFKFSLGIAGYVVAGIGFILFILGLGGNAFYMISGAGLMALGVCLFFNVDNSLTKIFRNDGSPD